MKFFKIIIGLVMIMLVSSVTAARGAQSGGQQSNEPRLVIEAFSHDFGEVKPGTSLKHSFIIKNLGKADLLIQSVKPG